MDALERAEQVLARARAHRANIVTPDSATSPMDQANTVQIPRAIGVAAESRPANRNIGPEDPLIPTAVFGRKAPAPDDLGPAPPWR